MSNNLHPRTHIINIVKSSNQKIDLIKRCFTNFSAQNISTLYKSIVRPVLEYRSPVWAPWHKKDISILESVQRKCLNICKTKINLESLQYRRKISDLTEVYKLMHNLYKTLANTFFNCLQRFLRGHPYKIFKQHSRSDVRKYFFSNRVVDLWNALPEEVVSAPSLNLFKKRLRSLPMD